MSKDKTSGATESPEITSTTDFNPAYPSESSGESSGTSMLQKIFAPNKIADESKIRIIVSESAGVCQVNCIETGIGAAFRTARHPDLLAFVKAEHDKTRKWLAEKEAADQADQADQSDQDADTVAE